MKWYHVVREQWILRHVTTIIITCEPWARRHDLKFPLCRELSQRLGDGTNRIPCLEICCDLLAATGSPNG